MPFTVIKGTFRLVSKTSTGKPTGFEPDGDSMQFKPDKPKLLDKLQKLASPYRLTSIGSTQLRFEGIDALELHFTAGKAGVTHQPRPLADDARDELVKHLGLAPVSYKPPQKIRVLPPAIHDGMRGWILSRSLEVHGRPVSFVFGGDAAEKDGSSVMLDTALLKNSANYQMLSSGQAYPLFYDSLFADLRNALAQASASAKAAHAGLWGQDLTSMGLTTSSIKSLQAKGVVFPKLFRRLAEYFGSGHQSLSGFKAWLAAKQERVLDLDTTNSTHFDTYVDVGGSKVSLNKSPDRLVFTSATSKSAPWV
ncbi:MAG TPA: nuclease [Verrucomicrobiae bacterium]|nr:nuclease [Verrucomicrobiae bacterium]